MTLCSPEYYMCTTEVCYIGSTREYIVIEYSYVDNQECIYDEFCRCD